MKIVIAGAGDVGQYLAKKLLKDNHEITVIDTNAKRLSILDNNFDVLTIVGSSTSIEILEQAGINTTKLFIAVTSSEEINLISANFAKKLGAEKTVARVDKMEYLQPKNRHLFLDLKIDRLIYPEFIAAKEVIGLLKQTGTSEIFDFSKGKLSLFVIKLDKDALVLDKSLKELAVDPKKSKFRVVAISRNSKTIIPKGSERFREDDLVYLISNPNGFKDLMKMAGKSTNAMQNIMIMGGSRIAKTVAKRLEKQANVKLIEIDANKCEELVDFFDKTLVINADGRDLDILKGEGIENMDAFLALTGNSEANILTSIIAKRYGVKRTIAEIENLDYIDIANKMGVDTIINKKLSAVSSIHTFTMNADIASAKCLTGSDAEILELVANKGSIVTQKPIKEINFPKGAIIGGVIRGEKSFIALGDTQIKPNDFVVVYTLPEALNKVPQFFK